MLDVLRMYCWKAVLLQLSGPPAQLTAMIQMCHVYSLNIHSAHKYTYLEAWTAMWTFSDNRDCVWSIATSPQAMARMPEGIVIEGIGAKGSKEMRRDCAPYNMM